jgi:hypothetical protein
LCANWPILESLLVRLEALPVTLEEEEENMLQITKKKARVDLDQQLFVVQQILHLLLTETMMETV